MAANEVSRGIVRWAARLTGAGSLAFLSLFVGAHIFGDNPGPAPTPAEWCLLVFFPGGVMIGLGLALFRSRAGAIVALGSLGCFYLVHLFERGSFPAGSIFFLIVSPAVLSLFSGLLDRHSTSNTDENHREPGPSKKNPEEPGCGLGTAS